MFECLNIVVSLLLTLLQIYEWRNELNKQSNYLKLYCEEQAKSASNKEKKQYKSIIRGYEEQERELNLSVDISRYISVTMVILVINYTLQYNISHHVASGVSAILMFGSFPFSSWLIKRITIYMNLYNQSTNHSDVIFVVSFVLCIPLMIHDRDLGLYAIAITLGKYIWFDLYQSKRLQVREIIKVFKDEIEATIISVHITILYLMLYAVYLCASKDSMHTKTIMVVAYVVVTVCTVSAGNGNIITTKAVKEAISHSITKKDSIKSKDKKKH